MKVLPRKYMKRNTEFLKWKEVVFPLLLLLMVTLWPLLSQLVWSTLFWIWQLVVHLLFVVEHHQSRRLLCVFHLAALTMSYFTCGIIDF